MYEEQKSNPAYKIMRIHDHCKPKTMTLICNSTGTTLHVIVNFNVNKAINKYDINYF